MSETHDSTSLQGLHSVAERLRMSGFRQTGIARAVTELVGEYLGIHANIGPNLISALGNTNNAASVVLDSKVNSVNDTSFKKTKELPVGDLSRNAANDTSSEELKKAA